MAGGRIPGFEENRLYTPLEVNVLLKNWISRWQSGEIGIVELSESLQWFCEYLSSRISSEEYRNPLVVPVCYFSQFTPLSVFLIRALLMCSYIRSSAVSLAECSATTYKELRQYSALVFSLRQFHEIEKLQQILHSLTNWDGLVFLGGSPFEYKPSLKKMFNPHFFLESVWELPEKLFLLSGGGR